MFPWESLDTVLTADNVPYLRIVYSKMPSSWSIFNLLSVVNITTPPVVLYYHNGMMAASSDWEQAFWDRVL